MMAIISELSMHQANALRLQQDLREKEAVLEECYSAMENGQPPSSEIEQEWMRYQRDEQGRQIAKQSSRMVSIWSSKMVFCSPKWRVFCKNVAVVLFVVKSSGFVGVRVCGVWNAPPNLKL